MDALTTSQHEINYCKKEQPFVFEPRNNIEFDHHDNTLPPSTSAANTSNHDSFNPTQQQDMEVDDVIAKNKPAITTGGFFMCLKL